MNNMNIKTMVLGMVQTNCYIISNIETREAIVIDPADDPLRLDNYLETNDLVCKAILLTHGHFDHILAANELSASSQAKIYAHEDEAVLLSDFEMNASTLFTGSGCNLTPDVLLKDGEELYLAGQNIKVIHTPGHTAGGVCYYFEQEEIVFTGDTLFWGDIGRTDLPTGNGRKLIDSINTKLMPLKDNIKVYPGHGRTTTIGYERANSTYLKDGYPFID